MSKNFYTEYNYYIDELKKSEKSIRDEINNYKNLSNQNTIDIERTIQEMLKNFQGLCEKLHTAYLDKNCPSSMPSKLIDSRQKEIRQFEINHKEIEKEFIYFKNNKYSFKNNITEDYSTKEEYKNMSTGELKQIQKDRLKEQDARIEDITLDVKKGTQLAKNAGKVINDQNKQLDEMNEDIDRTKEKMNSLTARFENYVGKYSVCKMIIILLIELAIAIVTGVLLLG